MRRTLEHSLDTYLTQLDETLTHRDARGILGRSSYLGRSKIHLSLSSHKHAFTYWYTIAQRHPNTIQRSTPHRTEISSLASDSTSITTTAHRRIILYKSTTSRFCAYSRTSPYPSKRRCIRGYYDPWTRRAVDLHTISLARRHVKSRMPMQGGGYHNRRYRAYMEPWHRNLPCKRSPLRPFSLLLVLMGGRPTR